MHLELSMETKQEIQLRLQYELIYSLEYIRNVTIQYRNNHDKLKKEISDLIIDSNPKLNKYLIQKAIELDIKFHKDQFREREDDPEVTHHFQAGLAVASTHGSLESVIAAIHHDSIEQNRNRKNEILNTLYLELGKAVGSKVLYLVMNHTNNGNIEDSNLKKLYLAEQIRKASEKDPHKELYQIRVCERISNLLSLDGIGNKGNRTSEERKLGIINETIKETLTLAIELDKIYKSKNQLKFYPLVREILLDEIPKLFYMDKEVIKDNNFLKEKRLLLYNKIITETLPLTKNIGINYKSELNLHSSFLNILETLSERYNIK